MTNYQTWVHDGDDLMRQLKTEDVQIELLSIIQTASCNQTGQIDVPMLGRLMSEYIKTMHADYVARGLS